MTEQERHLSVLGGAGQRLVDANPADRNAVIAIGSDLEAVWAAYESHSPVGQCLSLALRALLAIAKGEVAYPRRVMLAASKATTLALRCLLSSDSAADAPHPDELAALRALLSQTEPVAAS
jgi:hypothetical protein